ncbi:MAG: DNA polymerase III subunit beta [Bacilli bacterium]|nr:DNA polymerase III subunit beta [Clostridium sp.]MDY6015458.1 DNA polymerase III subunit beta [Bacilli bacterium]
MKIKIKKELLLENLNKVSKAISTKNLIPILSGIKFDLTKEGLTLTASDNDITIQTFIPADNKEMEIEKEGSIIIQGKYVLDIVRKLPDEFINIEVIDELKILIYAENSEFNLNGINQKEYPNVALENSKNFVKINTKLFKTIINQTAFATSTDESRPILTGINIKITGDILECSATDSYRLAKKQAKLNEIAGETYNIIVPGKNIVEFMKILNEGNEELEIHIFSNKVLFKQNNLLFQSRLVSGNYPNVNNLIPSDSFLKITANLSNLYDVIDRASILTSDKEKNIVTLETNKNLLIVRSSSAEIGRVEEKMNITKDNEEEIKISFSAKYMMDALRSFEGDTVELAFEGEVKPIIIKDVEDPNLTQLVLPIRTY